MAATLVPQLKTKRLPRQAIVGYWKQILKILGLPYLIGDRIGEDCSEPAVQLRMKLERDTSDNRNDMDRPKERSGVHRT